MAEQSAFLTAFDEMQKKKGGFNAPAPLESVVDTVGQAPAVQSPFSQQAAAATAPLAAPIDLSAAPAVQAPQELTADSFGPVAFPGLQQQGMDTRLESASEEQQRMNAMSKTLSDGQIQKEREGSTVGGFVENAAKKGFDYLFGAPTAEQAQNTLDTMPTDPDQRARLQATAAGEGVPSDLSKAGSFFFGRPEVAGDPNTLGAQAPAEVAVGTPTFGLADPSSSTATGEDPFSAPIVTPTAEPVADSDQQFRLADPTSSTLGLNSTQAMLQERFGSPTISGIQSAEEGLGLRTDAQGRMIDPNVDRSSFEQASADREARQADRPDFGTAASDRDRRAARGDDMSDADRRDIAKANQRGASAGDVARGDKVAEANGIDRKTGKPLEGDGLTFDQQLKLRSQKFNEGKFEYEATKDAKELYDASLTEAKEAKTAEAKAESVGKGLASSVADMRDVMGRASGRLDGFFSTDMVGKAASFWKGSDADAQEADFAFLKSNVALNAMMELKANSPTGSTGFGALNTEELKVLTNQFATLDPFTDSKLVRQNLKQLNERFEGIIQNAYNTHAAEYGKEAADGVYGSMVGGKQAQGQSNQAPSGKSVTTPNGKFTATAVID